MKFAILAGAAVTLSFAACATPEGRTSQASLAEPQGDDVVCEYIKRPGSNLGERVCEDRAYREQRLRDAQEGHRQSVNSSQNPMSEAGGL